MNKQYCTLNVNDLKVDFSYQREPDAKRIKKIAAEWDDEKVNVIHVSEREDGYYVIDGNHTRLAYAMTGGTDIFCEVHKNLTPQGEARLFAELNTCQLRPSFNQVLKAKAEAGIEPENTYLQILKKSGIPFTLSKGSSGSVACHSALLSVFKMTTPVVFERALKTADCAADGRDAFYKVGYFPGLCSLVVLHTDVDDVRLIQVARRATSSKVAEIADGQRRGLTIGGSNRTVFYRKAFIELYNVRIKNKIKED